VKPAILLDAGPLVAFFREGDANHDWALAQFAEPGALPFLSCDAVVAEASYLLRRERPGGWGVLELAAKGALRLPFAIGEHAEEISRLMRKYADVPMSLADACLVRMAELYPDSAILTLDRDFRLYRKHGRRALPLIMPSGL